MADERASLRKPDVVDRQAAAVAAAARPMSVARTLQQRLGNRGTQVLAAQVVARSNTPGVVPDSRIMRKKGTRTADDGPRSFTISVRWHGDAGDFFSAVVTAIARKTGIPEAALFQPCYAPAHRVHSEMEVEAGSRRKRSVRIDVALEYNADVFPSVNGLSLAPNAVKPGARPEAEKPPPPAKPADEAIPPNETPAQRLDRQTATTVRVLAGVVSDADREGYASVVITIEHTADEVSFDFEKREPKTARRSGTTPVSAATVAREHMKPLVDAALMGEGSYRIEFARGAEGRFEFTRAQRIEKAPPPGPGKTEREMLDEMGIPDRKKIYADIFKETERELKEAGVMVASFAIEQLVLYVAGGLLLRGLGLLGRAAARGFPHLLRALQFGQKATVARALGTLVESEASEFAALMNRVQKGGSLSKAELTRLGELTTKVEAAIASDVPSLRVIGRIKESPRLVKEAESINEVAQREVDALLEQYLAGNTNPGIGTKALSGDIKYLRGHNGGRLFFRENAEGYLEILGKADKSNESAVINTLLKLY